MSWRRRALAATSAAVAAVLLFNVFFLWRARSDRPVRSDVVVAIGGDNPAFRLGKGLTLVREGYAPLLVTDIPAQIEQGCHQIARGIPTECFYPVPLTTRGEARAVAAMAKERHWGSVLLVVSRYQASRARIRFSRCFPGRLTVVTVPTDGNLLYNTVYQDAATVKAEVWERAC